MHARLRAQPSRHTRRQQQRPRQLGSPGSVVYEKELSTLARLVLVGTVGRSEKRKIG